MLRGGVRTDSEEAPSGEGGITVPDLPGSARIQARFRGSAVRSLFVGDAGRGWRAEDRDDCPRQVFSRLA